ncbi:hypothetical protein NDU88_006547 [Pleurodeles waltl]|uniref:Uncharacterized protein n=1 Tax=Pleurodeles waltl TaxID=8319 RepID=A0AAV7QIC1_PLEWA|nr:hypothetical protein NDU88_006547 [Pleurodeles waltl]
METALQRQIKTEPVNTVTNAAAENKKTRQKPTASTKTCYMCGGSYPHQGPCPAQGKKCLLCNKLKLLAKVCRSSTRQRQQKPKQVNLVQPPMGMGEEDDIDDDDDNDDIKETSQDEAVTPSPGGTANESTRSKPSDATVQEGNRAARNGAPHPRQGMEQYNMQPRPAMSI